MGGPNKAWVAGLWFCVCFSCFIAALFSFVRKRVSLLGTLGFLLIRVGEVFQVLRLHCKLGNLTCARSVALTLLE